MRLVAAVALAVTVVAATAEAAISPVFDRERAQPGETVTLVLGPGSEAFRAPLRFALVAADLELSLTGPEDPRPVPIGDIGTPGELDVPDRYPFVVPDVPPGEYVAVLWSQSVGSARWLNIAEGLRVALAIDSPDDSAASGWLWLALAVAALGLAAGALVVRERRRTRAGSAK